MGIVSRQTMERWIGAIALSLSVILFLFNFLLFEDDQLRSSISHYYYTGMRNVFVSALSFTAFFLFAYMGYDNVERQLSNVAGFFALAVAWLPTSEIGESDLIGTIHLICAAIFFVIMGIFPYFFFTKLTRGARHWVIRITIYRFTGIIVLTALVLIGIQQLAFHDFGTKISFVFYMETLALSTLGVSWLIKSGALFGYEDFGIER